MTLDEAMAACAALGFGKFEAFTSWTAARIDLVADPADYRRRTERHGMRCVSMHLPVVEADDAPPYRLRCRLPSSHSRSALA